MNVETAAPKSPITLNPVSKPKKKAAESHGLEDLDALLAQVVLLKNMAAQIITNFPGDAGAGRIRKAVESFAKQVSDRAEELRDSMTKEARHSVDSSLVRLTNSLVTLLKDDLKGSFQDVRQTYLTSKITPPKGREPVDADVAFVKIEGLRGADGYRHQTFFLVVAHPTSSSSTLPPFLIAATPEFAVPIKVRWDATARGGKELHKVAKDLLVQDGIIGRAFTRNVPVPESRIKFAHDNVKSTTVRGDVITVRVKDPKIIDDTCAELRGQLAGIVKQVDPKNKDVIRDRVQRDTGIIQFVFSLPGNVRGRLVPNNVLREIQRLLNMNDEELQRVKTALENPE